MKKAIDILTQHDTNTISLAIDSDGNYQLLWSDNADDNIFNDNDRYNPDQLQPWMPDAIRDAIAVAIDMCAGCESDMDWFATWADDAESTIQSLR